MREHSLRTVLLVKAVEEADKTGALITAAERISAAKAARRDAPASLGSEATRGSDSRANDSPNGAARSDGPLTGAAQRMLVQRADILGSRLIERYPFIAALRTASGGPRHATFLIVALALLLGFGLSALDGSTRINLLSPGIIGLVLWNLAVYVWLIWRAVARRSVAKGRPLARLVAHNATAAMLRLIARSASFNAPLAGALKTFSREWLDAARPLLLARATRVVHFGAAAIGTGLIAGLYARGVAVDYLAGWESTFLDAPQVRVLFQVLYGPASTLSTMFPWEWAHLALPDAAQVEAMRFTGNAGGERAAKWIHLLAASIALYVIVPRVVLALIATGAIARWALRMPLPPTLPAYFRNVFSAVDSSIGRGIVMVVPYAHAIGPDAIGHLRELLPATFGNDLAVDLREPIAYGSEEEFIRHLPDRGGTIADIVVVLFNLAATPEDENHGALLTALRDWMSSSRRHAQLLVLLDSGPYAERMGSDNRRVDERWRAWEAFVALRGLSACVVDLSLGMHDEATGVALKKALWQPE